MAAYIPDAKVAEILSATDIVSVISQYVPLKRAGRNFTGLCPFHDDKRPSLHVSPEKQIYKCFVCNEGGNAFTFLMKRENMNFPEVVKLLANRVGIEIVEERSEAWHKKEGERADLYRVNDWACRVFENALQKTAEGQTARTYIEKRKISPKSVREFRLGYAPPSWDSLIVRARGAKVPTALLEKAGLIVKRRKGEGYRDAFVNRLIFPILDVQERVIGFGARALPSTSQEGAVVQVGEDNRPKYVNSPETPLFNKSKVLYGLNFAKKAVLDRRQAILMEGYTDVIMAHQHGVNHALAVLGTALTRDHVRQLRRYADEVILIFDADAAGQKSADRSLDIFVEEDTEAKVAVLPAGQDPCDYLLSNGAESFLGGIDGAKDLLSFKMDLAASHLDMSSVQGRWQAIDGILSTLTRVSDPVRKDLLLKRVAEEMAVDEGALRGRLSQMTQSHRRRPQGQYGADPSDAGGPSGVSSRSGGDSQERALAATAGKANQRSAEKELLEIMLVRNDLVPHIFSQVSLDDFADPDIRALATRIIEVHKEDGALDQNALLIFALQKGIDKPLTEAVTIGATIKDFTGSESLSALDQDEEDHYKEWSDGCIRTLVERRKAQSSTLAKQEMLAAQREGETSDDVEIEFLKSFEQKVKLVDATGRAAGAMRLTKRSGSKA